MKLRFRTLLICLLPGLFPFFAQATATTEPGVNATIISRDVLVAAGDTLRSIARRELGRTGFAPQLAEFNGLVVSAPLVPGNIVRIPIHVPARGEFARVVFVKGLVLSRRASASTTLASASTPYAAAFDTTPLVRDAEIVSGDIITTGIDGYVSIEFSSGSVINLQPDSEAQLTRLNCLPGDDSCIIEIRTERGKVTSDVETRDNQPVDFRIDTPYASAAVRGTVFDIEATDKLLVGVTEGEVDVAAQSESVALELGFGSLVEAGQPPSAPIALLPAPIFKRVPARMAPGDTVGWWPYDNASRYGAQVTNDEGGNEKLLSLEVSDDAIGFDSLDSGDYYLHVRAVDDNGLRGFSSNTRITVASIDATIEPVDTTVTKQGREFLVSIVNPPLDAPGYEIQISSNPAFEDPLSVDVNQNGTAVFRLDNDRVYSRARVLVNPFIVSAYGNVASSDGN